MSTDAIQSVSPAAASDSTAGSTEDGCGKVIADLAGRLADTAIEIRREAKRAMWKVVRRVGGPGAVDEKTAVLAELNRLLQVDQPAVVYREVLWMLSEIGGDASIESIARLLSNESIREDARMAMERIPGNRSLAALEAALDAAPDGFKLNIAQSLRARGGEVHGLPCRKLTPSKQTKVRRARRATEPAKRSSRGGRDEE